MLKMTKIKLELISDSEIDMVFEKGTTCRISYISNRYSKANNKHLKSYDQKQELKHVIYLDTVYIVIQCLNFFQQVDSNG